MTAAEMLAPAVPVRDPSPRLWTDAEFARMAQLGIFGGRDVELRGGVVCDRGGGPVVITRKEYYALEGCGLFRDQRVQLIGGVILREVVRMNPPHANAIRKARRAIERVFGDGYDVSVQLPIDLGLVSEPQPDISVIAEPSDDLSAQHPTSAVLVIEVAESTIESDTHDKASLYAAGGIEDYWVVVRSTDRVLVFRSPRPEIGAKFGSNYGSVSAHTRDDILIPLAAPNARVAVGDLLP